MCVESYLISERRYNEVQRNVYFGIDATYCNYKQKITRSQCNNRHGAEVKNLSRVGHISWECQSIDMGSFQGK